MAVFTNTELAATIDEKWDLSVEEGRYEAGVLANRVFDKSSLVLKHGDIINLSYEPRYTVNDVTAATGAVSPQVVTITPVQLTVDKWKEMTIEVVDKSKWQSFYDPESRFPKTAGKGLVEQADTDLGALYPNLTSNVIGTSAAPGIFDKKMFSAAMLKLRDRSIPLDGLGFYLTPRAFYDGILQQTEMTAADATGQPKSVLTTGYRTTILGVPMYESTKLATLGSARACFLLHEQAFAVAFQKKNDIRRADGIAAGKLSMIVSVNSLYGVKTFREDHGCLLWVRNS